MLWHRWRSRVRRSRPSESIPVRVDWRRAVRPRDASPEVYAIEDGVLVRGLEEYLARQQRADG